MKHTLKEIVKDNTAKLSYICNGVVYFNVDVDGTLYQFPIDGNDTSEWKDMYIYPEYKAITLMRWIRKSIQNETLIQLN
jgi:hypothetical protein